jgi:hypothetical protein
MRTITQANTTTFHYNFSMLRNIVDKGKQGLTTPLLRTKLEGNIITYKYYQNGKKLETTRKNPINTFGPDIRDVMWSTPHTINQ